MARVVTSITLCVDCTYYRPADKAKGILQSCWHPKVRVNGRGVVTSVAIPDFCPLPKILKEPDPPGLPPFRTVEEWDRHHKRVRNWNYMARHALAMLMAAITNLDLSHTSSGLQDMTHDQAKQEDLPMSAVIDFLNEFFEEHP